MTVSEHKKAYLRLIRIRVSKVEGYWSTIARNQISDDVGMQVLHLRGDSKSALGLK